MFSGSSVWKIINLHTSFFLDYEYLDQKILDDYDNFRIRHRDADPELIHDYDNFRVGNGGRRCLEVLGEINDEREGSRFNHATKFKKLPGMLETMEVSDFGDVCLTARARSLYKVY